MDWGIKAKEIRIPEGQVKQIFTNGTIIWQAPSEVTYMPILPDDTTTYPIYKNDPIAMFAVTDGTRFGYYAPSTKRFTVQQGMIGNVIQRCEYVEGNNDAWCVTNNHMVSTDVWRMRLSLDSTNGNIGGCYSSGSAQDNFCLYAGSNGTKWYMRYDGTTNRNFAFKSGWHNFVANPSGAIVDDYQVETWTPSMFTCSAPLCIGWLNGSTSPKIFGKIAYFEIVGKWKYLPVKVGNSYLLFDVLGWEFPEQHGIWRGGPVIEEVIPFPV